MERGGIDEDSTLLTERDFCLIAQLGRPHIGQNDWDQSLTRATDRGNIHCTSLRWVSTEQERE